ncbi:MAG: SpoIIE family protein phosphatase [Spirochaetia bacterium]
MNEKTCSHLRHELRTSLNHINGFAELLKEDIDGQTYEKQCDQLKAIMDQSEKIKDLVSARLGKGMCRFISDPIQIKEEFYSEIYEIIEKAQEIRNVFRKNKMEEELLDIGRMLTAGNSMLDMLDEGLTPETDQASPMSEEKDFQEDYEDKPVLSSAEEGHILVVDDNEMNRHMLSRQLTRQGHKVVTAETGDRAIELMQEAPPDIAILDIMMPGMNGYQLLKIMKNDPLLMHIPVIMISALDEMDSVIRCIKMGAEDYLPKSVDPVLLKARIDASLEKKRLRDQEYLYYQVVLESHERLARELAEGAEYVRTLLPNPIEGIITTNWCFIPSAELGGDCFSYQWLTEDHFAAYLVDVSGHGIGAALLSVTVLNVLENRGLPGVNFCEPKEVLNALNKAFPMERQNNMYFSMWYGVFDRQSRKLTYACAGAPPAVAVKDEEETELGSEDVVIGVDEAFLFHQFEHTLVRDSRVYLFSDGVFEVRKPDGDIIGLEVVRDLIKTANTKKEDRISYVLNTIQSVSKKEDFEDDFSFLEITFL